MKQKDIVNSITNALGSNHFDPDAVVRVLYEKASEMREKGENAGSLIAVANLLPELAEEAKKRY